MSAELSQINLYDGSIVVAVFSLVAGLVFGALRLLARWMRYHLSSPLARCTVVILDSAGCIPDATGTGEGDYRLFCLLVRHGRDEYLEKMASDQERYEGRLLNRVIRITDLSAAGLATFELPVHRRLGTQFKLFIEGRDGDTVDRLVGAPCFFDGDRDGNKIWFLHQGFPIVDTLDDHRNNYYPASRLPTFTAPSLQEALLRRHGWRAIWHSFPPWRSRPWKPRT